MSLLREIQQSLMNGDDIEPILVKLMYLASRLGSNPLEEWVKHELEGYPEGVDVPEYRKTDVTYKGHFVGIAGRQMTNVQIPPQIIADVAGKEWLRYNISSGIAGIDDIVRKEDDGETIGIGNTSALLPSLANKVYDGFTCIELNGILSRMAFVELQSCVRAKTMELTIELEKAVPAAADVVLAKPEKQSEAVVEKTTNVFNQTIYGNYTGVTSTGDAAQITAKIAKGDRAALLKALTDGGIPEADAAELAEIADAEGPESADEPFGARAKEWLSNGIGKIADGAWKISTAAATKLVTEALLRFHGYK